MARALSFAQGHAEPAQLPLPDVLLLRAVRLGRASTWRFVWLDRARGHRWRRCSSCTSPIRPASTRPAARSAWLAGTATVAARLPARRAARRIGRTAIAAAVFLAVSPLHVRDSHYVKHDVPATLAIVARVSGDRRASGPAPAASDGGGATTARLRDAASPAPRAASRSRRTTTASSWRCRWPGRSCSARRDRRRGRRASRHLAVGGRARARSSSSRCRRSCSSSR